MTTFKWGALHPGEYGLPAPAVVMSSWQLEVRAPRPRRRGFRLVRQPSSWNKVRPARDLVVDYSTAEELIVICAERPERLNVERLRQGYALAAAAGVRWLLPALVGRPTVAFQDQVHEAGRLLLLTGDLSVYWSARESNELPSFRQLFPGGTWAAWAPLQVHLYADGVGTRPG